ncbi:GDSL-like Lipase/Acylhydrolase family protein [Actinacidiphila yanglinensis]|uniref:GDSL-like Lipase/Acylhydrolase family protein n=1 Tax=Actinacidiphila yanglinensis TaxID=310779 RepID=A0A1H6E4I0_9ACTN|nr:SGNH/GDSL hydrolase family protein [Actinacidiphila yanglinensis]SEG92133.1 GDSL-like Lipase/Acylhydrolase family protein [Actinacidiphila yanglinensis]
MGAALLCAGAVLAPAGTAAASTGTGSRHAVDYVALGDSYASAPVVPTQIDATCLRSSQNYPSLVAQERSAALTDVSCSGATTADMTASQEDGVAPQLAALDRRTDLVTVTIGGNDIGFSTVLGTCAQLTSTDAAGAPCEAHFAGGGTDRISAAIDQTASKVAGVLRDVHRRAPHARVVVVGYPDLFPDDGVGCTSASVPLAAGDFAWLRDKEKELNAMLAGQARHGRARYADTYTPTVGHDLCRPTGERWIETFAPQTPAAPVHPNAAGERAMATAVEKAVGRHV